MSELAGPWLNLPLMLVGGAGDVLKDIKPLEDDRTYVNRNQTKQNKTNSLFFFFCLLILQTVLNLELERHDERVSTISFYGTKMLLTIQSHRHR